MPEACFSALTKSDANDLAWIRDRAAHYVRHQGVTHVLLFDSASTRYGAEDVTETLRKDHEFYHCEHLTTHWGKLRGAAEGETILNDPKTAAGLTRAGLR